MRILTNTFAIIVQMVLLAIGITWYIKSPEQEPLMAIITTSSLLVSLLVKYTVKQPRPKIVFHSISDFYSREPKGYTPKNKKVIRLGIDKIYQYWELCWVYVIEIRNNSSVNAYNIKIDLANRPPRTRLEGEIGKIQPIMANEKIEFRFKLFQDAEGTHDEADEYLRKNVHVLLMNMQIVASYTDEHDKDYLTEYSWTKDANEFPYTKKDKIFSIISGILILFGLLVTIGYFTNFSFKKNEIKSTKVSHPNAILKDTSEKKTLKKVYQHGQVKPSNNTPPVIKYYDKSIQTKEKKDTVIPNVQNNIGTANIVTTNQSGGTNIVLNPKVEIPKPDISYAPTKLNEKVTKILDLDNNINRDKRITFPSDEYNFDYLYRSEIEVTYKSAIVQNGFGFLIQRNDCIVVKLNYNGMSFNRNGTYKGFKFVSIERPSNGVYKLCIYTKEPIDKELKFLQLLL